MTSKLVVNTIEADTGISSVSFASSISMSSTSKFHFSAAGIDIDADTNINRPSAGVLGFNINGAEKFRIDTNGHLNTSGIVTAANFKSGVTNVHNLGLTLSGGQLDVGSNIKLGNAGVVTAAYYVGSGAASLSPSGNADELVIGASNGTRGITIFGATSNIFFGDSGDNDIGQIQYEHSDNSMRFNTNASERIRITSGGLVGVGQASPTHMLHVDSSNASDSTATAFFKGRIIRFDGAASAHSPRLNFSLDGTDKAQILLHRTNVGLDIATLAAEPIKFKTNSVERVRIPEAGGIELNTDGKGIQFPTPQTPYHANTARTGISSEMRYYETGTVTPNLSSTVLNGLQIATFTDASFARRVNRYVRVGHLVFCTIEIKMASSVTYNAGNTSTAPVCIVGTCPFKWAYSGRYDVSGEPDFIPCSISYDSSGLSNDTVYAALQRNYNAQPRIDITKVGSGGSRQYNSTNFGEVFPANASIAVSYCYPIDLDNADY